MGSKKTTTTSNQNTTAATTQPQWVTDAAQKNYGAMSNYVNSGAGTWDASKAATYMNPYQSQVTDNTVAQMGRDDAKQLATQNDQFTAAKAYGGTRQAVLDSDLEAQQGRAMGDYRAQANAQAYSQGQQQFDSDRTYNLGSYQGLMQALATAPRNTTTTGTSNGTDTQTQNAGLLNQLLGGAATGAGLIFSDPRLKRDVSRIDELPNGLGVYRFRYLWDGADEPEHIGVMADEVERIAPAALGPVIAGFRTVDYAKLAEMI